MERPEKLLNHTEFVGKGTLPTRRLLAYLLRATVKRVDKLVIGERRYQRLAGEISANLIPLITGNQSLLSFYSALCSRFQVDATGSDTKWGPIEAWLPEGRIRWDHALAAMDYRVVRAVIEESPEFLATFARSHGDEAEDSEFGLFPDPAEALPQRVTTLPKRPIATNSLKAVWTLAQPLHHGADQKSGNVSMFRRQQMHDPLTGKTSQVPFVSGNAIRGQWRDLAMLRWLELLGIQAKDIPPIKAHALLAGGSVDQGADTSKVNNVIRREARSKCPPWDLLGGCIDSQIMAGRFRVGDAIVVCRENAWLVHSEIAPDVPLEEFASSLPEAATMLSFRQRVRSKHAEISDSEGVQMLCYQEVIAPGYQLTHSIQLLGSEGVSRVTASCLADLLETFQRTSCVGAATAGGFGGIQFEAYRGEPSLPSSSLYLETVANLKEEMLEWVLRAPSKTKLGKGG